MMSSPLPEAKLKPPNIDLATELTDFWCMFFLSLSGAIIDVKMLPIDVTMFLILPSTPFDLILSATLAFDFVFDNAAKKLILLISESDDSLNLNVLSV